VGTSGASSDPSPERSEEDSWRCEVGIVVTVLAIIGLIVVVAWIL